jgi:hypothetical protein
MAKSKFDITDLKALAIESFRRLGGIEEYVKWGRLHRTLYYTNSLPKLLAQPTVQTVNVAVINEEATRVKLQDALLRQIEARKFDDVDPVVTVNGERIIDQSPVLTHDAITRDTRPATADPAPGSDFENLKSPIQGPLFDRGGVSTTPGEGKKNQSVYSKPIPSIPGLAAGVALDGSDDNRSTTQKYLDWSRRGGGMP